MENKPKDFTTTEFIGKGENLVMDRKQENFYLVNEAEYDSAKSEDQINCEILYSIEYQESIKYYRHEPKLFDKLQRGKLQSVLLQ